MRWLSCVKLKIKRQWRLCCRTWPTRELRSHELGRPGGMRGFAIGSRAVCLVDGQGKETKMSEMLCQALSSDCQILRQRRKPRILASRPHDYTIITQSLRSWMSGESIYLKTFLYRFLLSWLTFLGPFQYRFDHLVAHSSSLWKARSKIRLYLLEPILVRRKAAK